MYLKIRGLVLREVRYKESSRILTVLSEEHGRLTITARGALRKKSRIGAAAQALCFSEFSLFGSRGRWVTDEGSSIEQFIGLRDDIAKLALGVYFAELLETFCAEEVPSDSALSLGLNALYALSRDLYDPVHIKSVLELRLACAEGFEPQADVCGVCGRMDIREPMFSPAAGMVHCRDCAPFAEGASLSMDGDTLRAMRHIITSPAKKVFSFAVPPQSEERLAAVSEAFIRWQTGHEPASLSYWKSVK